MKDMKIIIETQIRENYAAHTGFTGEFYWKMKGGNTYIAEDIQLGQADDLSFWKTLEQNVCSFDNYFEEYIIDSQLVDNVIPNSDFYANWDTPIMLEVTQKGVEASRSTCLEGYESLGTKIETWIQEKGERKDYDVVFISDDGVVKDSSGKVIGHAESYE